MDLNLTSFIRQGGVIAYILVGMSILGMGIVFWKMWVFRQFGKKVKPRLPNLILGRTRSAKTDRHIVTEAIDSEIALAFKPLSSGLTTIETIAGIAPMLGLLGTVIGIFDAFTQIVAAGMDDPSIFADGIRLALVTTVIGLVVAIPHLVAYNHLSSWLESSQDETENEVFRLLGSQSREQDSLR